MTSLCFLIALSRSSSIILSKYGESGQPCLLPEFIGIAWSFSPFSLMLATSLLYITFTMFKYQPWIPDFSKTFAMEGCWILSHAFSGLNEMTMCFFFLWVWSCSELHCWISLHWSIPDPWEEAYLIMVNDSFDVYLDSISKSFIKYFYIDIRRRNCSHVHLLCWNFVWFWHQCICGFIERFGECFFCFYFVEQFKSIDIRSSLKVV